MVLGSVVPIITAHACRQNHNPLYPCSQLATSVPRSRTPEAESQIRQEASDAHAALDDLEQQLAAAPKGKKAALEAQVEAARDKAVSAARDLHRLEHGPMIEVGALEDVVVNMERDEDGVWGQVVFVPSGSLQGGGGGGAAEEKKGGDQGVARKKRWGWGK